MVERTGGCQCGQARYRVIGDPLTVAVCHCRECQRQSGSAFGMTMVVPEPNFSLVGELKSFERGSDSGRPLRCYFCGDCGTRLYHVPAYAKGVLNIKPGTLDDTSWLQPKLHVWTCSQQGWFELPRDVPLHERQP